MTTAAEGRPTDLVDEVARRVHERFGDDADRVEDLVREYYDHVATDDLVGRSPTDLYGAAIAHLQLARQRRPGDTLVRVYAPSVDDDGWRSPHTVVDVVTDDMPFIVASVVMAVERTGFDVHLLVHPVLSVRRRDGDLMGTSDDDHPDEAVAESLVHLEIDRVADPATAERLRADVVATLADVRAAVADWQEMVTRARDAATGLATMAVPGPTVTARPERDPSEIAALLRWMADEHFIFLGARDYRLDPDEGVIRSVDGTGLGLSRHAPRTARALDELPPDGAAQVIGPDILLLTKTNRESTVHRAAPMDYVGVRFHEPDGVIVERRFIGLFTSRAYTETVTRLPIVRRKVAEVVRRAGAAPGSHDATQLLTVLESHPRDELFQAGVDELLATTTAIARLVDRRQVRLFLRREAFGRFTSCLVFVPRDRFHTGVRIDIEAALADELGGTHTSFTAALSSSPFARLHVVVRTRPEHRAPVDHAALEARITRICRTWEDDLERALVDAYGEGTGLRLFARYREAFPAGYRDEVPPEGAAIDIDRLERLGAGDHRGGDLEVHMSHPVESPPDVLRCTLYRTGTPVTLSDALPLLQAHGVAVVDERPAVVRPLDTEPRYIYRFGMRLPEGSPIHTEEMRGRFEESFLAVWDGRAANDGLNRLVLTAALDWHEVALVRTYRQYLRQIGSTFTQAYVEEVLVRHSGIARLVVELFHHRLDPERVDDDAAEQLLEWINDALDSVPSLDEDRILRSFELLVEATVRTNFFRRDTAGDPPSAIAVKLDPSRIPDLPLPRPAHEIFVSSPRVEGTHLRAGRIARGGLRWSDRREDFRTEILGLMKAQVVKNAVIVPTGAKGGFVCRQLPPSGEPAEVRAEVVACYRTFIESLLDVTDDRDGDAVVPPDRVVRRDGDDPYLVVAADKGTATFSDIANEIAQRRGFWLGDAFASGGSTGYDHKAMGITARGAWVAVRRHLRELGIRVEHDPVSVVGIGDMSGDVFGNGMLLSRHLRVIAAFDHRHVFIDPDPDPEASWRERKRLFDLPRSSWADYDRDVLSPGGAIVHRTAKSVTVTAPMAAALDIDEGTLTPNELIRAVLRAPVDLLWNGGIGTYVKAASETHADVSDRSNDGVRVDAVDLRCRVIGEGGNLGLTQRGRVEAARRGVRLNTDAIDNAAGVDCSDHEVNLKVMLDQVVRAGELTVTQRNALLASMTDDVARLVLADNEAQTLALTTARSQANDMADVHARHLRWLEETGDLDRGLDALPSDAELSERANDHEGLTQPELAVVLAHTKNVVADALSRSDLPDAPAVADALVRYAPAAITERFPDALTRHPLRRELVATELTNRMVNRAGMSMVLRLGEETSAPVAEIVRAHVAAWRIHGLDEVWDEIVALDAELDTHVLAGMLLDTKQLGERVTRWLLRNRRAPLDIDAVVAELRPGTDEVTGLLAEVAGSADRERIAVRRADLTSAGVPVALADRVAVLSIAPAALDLVGIARSEGATRQLAAGVYFLVDELLGLAWLRTRIEALPRDDRWRSLARAALRDDLFHEHAALVRRILASGGSEPADVRVERWVDHNRIAVDRCLRVLLDIRSSGTPGLAQLSVGLREVRNLIHQAVAPPLVDHRSDVAPAADGGTATDAG
ncbi:MAG TPA: NAD-glutamate dehydrogenase [Acidimicrobiales bacterium]|nr:NAD-glutamate dehydrogenase [Acidimicrobiales bacterium]